MARGRFFATDDLNLQGHHLVDWRWLDDIPTDSASAGMALVYNGENVLWADLESGEFVAVEWDDIANKPNTFPPDSHTHPWDEVTAKPTFVNSVTAGMGIQVSATTGSNVVVALSDNVQDTLRFYVGAVLGQPVADVTSDGADISLTLTSPGDELTLIYHDSRPVFDTSGSPSIVLTAGTDAAPVLNYVWIPSDTQVLTVGSAWPSAIDYVPIATVYCQSAASAQTYGVYKMHAWTDHTHSDNGTGHLAHLNSWIRTQPATWRDGVAITPTLGAAQFDIALTSGTVLQLHDHAFPAMTTVGGSEPIYVYNDPVTSFKRVANLTAELTDSSSGTLSNRYYSVVVWGVVSEDAADCKMYVNLPSGSYNIAASAQADSSRYADYGIPIEFAGTGFLIARLVVRHQVAGNTFTLVESIDLRGTFPGGFTGGSAGSGDHGALIGLSDPDHPLTALQQSGATVGQVITWNGSTWVADDASGGVSEIVAGTFINVSTSTGTVTIAVDATSVATAGHSHVIADVTDVTTNAQRFSLNFLIDGIGAYITDGDKGYARLNCDCTLERASAFTDATDTVTFGVETATYAGHDGSYVDITGGNDLGMTSAKKVQNATLTSWDTDYSRGDLLRFSVVTTDAVVTQALIVLDFVRDW